MTALRSFDDVLARARQVTEREGRHILGIAGGPGSGKTTLAVALVRELNAGGCAWAAHVPMDGFHLADAELARLGRLDRKGAPDTFDAAGYAALLERLRVERSRTVYAPAFDREIEQPVAGAIPVLPEVRLVVTEGNYLLLEDDPWPRARAAMDEVWFSELPDDVRRQRLVDRHVRFGKPPEQARTWVAQVDEPNAALVAATRDAADAVVAPTVQGYLPHRDR